MSVKVKPIHLDFQCLEVFGLTDRELRRMLYDCGVRVWVAVDARERVIFEYVILQQLVRGIFKHTKWRPKMIEFFKVEATSHLDVDPVEILGKINSYWISEHLVAQEKRKGKNLRSPLGWKAF